MSIGPAKGRVESGHASVFDSEHGILPLSLAPWLLNEALMARGTAAWLAHFVGSVPAAPVQDLQAELTSDFVTSEDRVWTYRHPDRPDFRIAAPAFRLPRETMPKRAAPGFGTDTDAVLTELGYTQDRIAALRGAGAL